MAQANVKLIAGLRETASRLKRGVYYAWGHHGGCNCGNLAQVLNRMSKGEILRHAQQGIGEWTEISRMYCAESKAPEDVLVGRLIGFGLTPMDLHNLEYLSDKDVLSVLPGGFRYLQRNKREDVIAYMQAFANLLESRLPADVNRESELRAATDEIRKLLAEAGLDCAVPQPTSEALA